MTRLLRLLQLVVGNAIQGFGIALVVQAGLGLPGWDVFHQGLAGVAGVSFGTANIIVSLAILLAWIPLRVRPGVGTIINALLVGPMADLGLAVIPPLEQPWLRGAGLLGGTVLFALGTAVYMGAALGAGPRDGLMQGLAARGVSIRLARTILEASALAVGWLLGGTVGVGTVVYTLALGPVLQLFLPLFAFRRGESHPRATRAAIGVRAASPTPAAEALGAG